MSTMGLSGDLSAWSCTIAMTASLILILSSAIRVSSDLEVSDCIEARLMAICRLFLTR
jgi:hypothetical protein